MRKRRVPSNIIRMIEAKLKERNTYLKFDDYTSGALELENGIDQGCPLSMILYLYYNADMLEIPKGKKESGGHGRASATEEDTRRGVETIGATV